MESQSDRSKQVESCRDRSKQQQGKVVLEHPRISIRLPSKRIAFNHSGFRISTDMPSKQESDMDGSFVKGEQIN
jgi:hypothetical protein